MLDVLHLSLAIYFGAANSAVCFMALNIASVMAPSTAVELTGSRAGRLHRSPDRMQHEQTRETSRLPALNVLFRKNLHVSPRVVRALHRVVLIWPRFVLSMLYMCQYWARRLELTECQLAMRADYHPNGGKQGLDGAMAYQI